MSSGSCGLVTRVWVEAPSLARDETVTMMLCVSLGSKSVFFFGEWGGKAEENTYINIMFPLFFLCRPATLPPQSGEHDES